MAFAFLDVSSVLVPRLGCCRPVILFGYSDLLKRLLVLGSTDYNGNSDYTLHATQTGLACAVVGDALIDELDTIRTVSVSWCRKRFVVALGHSHLRHLEGRVLQE